MRALGNLTYRTRRTHLERVRRLSFAMSGSAEILEFERSISGRYAKKLELAVDTNRLTHRVIYSIKPQSEHAPDLILAALLVRVA
jgi:hypothetical protein